MITPQFIFMILGIVAFVLSVLLLVFALVYYFRNDIRGVKDDLSGKTRRTGQAEQRRRPRGGNQKRRVAPQVPASSPVGNVVPDIPNISGIAMQAAEDDLETVLDTKLRAVPLEFSAVSSDGYDVNDDMPTLVTSVGDYHQTGMSESGADDMPTVLEEHSEGQPAEVDSTASRGASLFVVTKSILAIHSSEIIAAD